MLMRELEKCTSELIDLHAKKFFYIGHVSQSEVPKEKIIKPKGFPC